MSAPSRSPAAGGGARSGAVAGPVPTLEPTPGDRLRRWRPTRGGMAVAALLLIALVVLALASPQRTGYLDPAAVDPSGSRAAATVLREQGVTVTDVRLASDAAANARGATVLLTDATLPTEEMVGDLLATGPARLVLVAADPSQAAFARLAAGIQLAEPADEEPLPPSCDLRAATQAGSAVLPGLRYDARAWADRASTCYDRPEAAGVVVLPARSGRPEVVLLGSPGPLTNERFDDGGNAALALNLLGAHEQLVWWRPTPADPALAGAAPVSMGDLLPSWVLPVVAQLVVAFAFAAVWRGARLGPLVVEPLPVVVRAGETTAGRARLLHAHHARGEAAEHLRAATREEVRVRLGLPVGCSPEALVHAVAARTSRSRDQLGGLLYGAQPAGDAELVALGHDLAELTVEVGRA